VLHVSPPRPPPRGFGKLIPPAPPAFQHVTRVQGGSRVEGMEIDIDR
jgi:hypothetical protein